MLDGVAADAQAQRLDRIPPHEHALEDEGHAEHQQQPEQHPPLAALAVDGLHQCQVEHDPDRPGDGHPGEHGDAGRPAGVDREGDDDPAEHGDLALGEVEDPAESVDQGQPDAEQPELQPEDDAVEDRRPHVRPRGLREPRVASCARSGVSRCAPSRQHPGAAPPNPIAVRRAGARSAGRELAALPHVTPGGCAPEPHRRPAPGARSAGRSSLRSLTSSPPGAAPPNPIAVRLDWRLRAGSHARCAPSRH